MAIFTNKPNYGEEVEVMSMEELSDMVIKDELHIVFGEKLYDHLLEVNVRFKGDDSRAIMVRNVYKDGRNNRPIPHMDTPSLKYIYKNKYNHGSDKGLPIIIPENFTGKIEIQGTAANIHSVSDIDTTGKKIIKTLLSEDCAVLREYWYLNPDMNKHDAIRMEEIKNYLLNKYAVRRIK